MAKALAPIGEDAPPRIDPRSALDPFDNNSYSSLSFRYHAFFPVVFPRPTIDLKEERIDQYFASQQNEEPQEEQLKPEYLAFLEKINDFQIQFYKDNPYRMRVFLTAENENGTPYFLSSYIRPSVLPLIEAHNVELAAEFVANLCNYQPLFDFFSQPRCITTANFTAKTQFGDCYDLSVLLTTLLTGIGYGAFVVVGYANREITLGDLRYKSCPGIAFNEVFEITDVGTSNKYLTKIQGRELHLESNFEFLQKNPPPPPPPPQKEVFPPIDDYEGRRMHCWVLVKSARVEIPETILIDPGTGDQYPLNSELFGYIELAFNNENVWINMQEPGFTRTDDTMNFDNTDFWKPVLSDELKMPSPVVERISIPDHEIFQRYPKGEKKLLWKDALEERYAPYTRNDGLVRRFFIFSGHSLANVREIREEFHSLRECLIERRYCIPEQKMIEKFGPGHPTMVKRHVLIHGKSRLLEFEKGRLDGLLSRREIFGEKIIEKFSDRDDGLYERKIRIVSDSSTTTSESPLYPDGPKMAQLTQKYLHPSKVHSHHTKHFQIEQSFYKVVFNLVDSSMWVYYHHQPGRITNFSIEYRHEKDRENEFLAITSKFYPQPPPTDSWFLTETQNQLQAIRNQGKNDAQAIALEMVKWIQFRTEEESIPYLHLKSTEVVLHRKLFKEMQETNVLVEQPPPELKPEGEEDAANAQQQLLASDPLSVYFPITPCEITEEVAREIQNRAIEALYKRLLEESEGLQQRLTNEMAILRKKNNEFEMDQHQSMSKKQSDDHNNFNTKQNFLIKVIQKRIARFEQTAATRLFDLLSSLKNHPKLSKFLGSTNISKEEAMEKIKSDLLSKKEPNA